MPFYAYLVPAVLVLGVVDVCMGLWTRSRPTLLIGLGTLCVGLLLVLSLALQG